MVIEFDFEIYKNGDYDKVYLRNGKLAGGISMVNRVLISCYL